MAKYMVPVRKELTVLSHVLARSAQGSPPVGFSAVGQHRPPGETPASTGSSGAGTADQQHKS